MVENKNLLLEKFKNRQSEKDTIIFQEAQRLVNQYRSLSCFDAEFVEQYNQVLLNSSPAVRRLLSTFMGGEEVEDYLEFLQQNFHLQKDELNQKKNEETKNKGYLPEPENDIRTPNGSLSVSRSEWEQMRSDYVTLKQQMQLLLKKVGNPNQTGVETGNFFDNKISSVDTSQTRTVKENYSEIIEESQEDKTHE